MTYWFISGMVGGVPFNIATNAEGPIFNLPIIEKFIETKSPGKAVVTNFIQLTEDQYRELMRKP